MTCPVEVPSIPLVTVRLRYRDPDDSDAALPISAVELAITSFPSHSAPSPVTLTGLTMATPALRRVGSRERASGRITRPT